MSELDHTLAADEPSGDADTVEVDSGEAPGSSPRHSDAPLEPGATVGRYEIVERLGAGGMGVVYRAHYPQLDRPRHRAHAQAALLARRRRPGHPRPPSGRPTLELRASGSQDPHSLSRASTAEAEHYAGSAEMVLPLA